MSVVLTYVVSYLMIPELGDGSLWWKLSTIITCGTLAGAIIPELVKVFTSTNSGHVREVVSASREGGPSLNIISGLVAGNFSGYWLGLAIMGLMAVAYLVSEGGLDALMLAPAVFAFGLVAFGFLGMGPVTIAVDSYGPVTDNAQSVYELSQIEEIPTVRADVKRDFGFEPNFDVAKDLLEENDGAGNTFKATAKPVLIGTAVVGSTTMIFSIIMALTHGLTENLQFLSILHPPFLLGLITGGAVIYWFTGASMQAVSTGAYRAVEFIKKNIKLEGTTRASVADSRKVVEICTLYAQKGMFNIFLGVFFSTLAFAFIEPYFFIGYLISIALFGLYQAIFMANAGGAWDNAKKIVETELKMKGTDLHAASIVGDTVGDPFKDTSSVAMNPVIKFTTLFGLLAVELGVYLAHTQGPMLGRVLSLAVLPAEHGVRVAVVLPDADRDRGGVRPHADRAAAGRDPRPGTYSPEPARQLVRSIYEQLVELQHELHHRTDDARGRSHGQALPRRRLSPGKTSWWRARRRTRPTSWSATAGRARRRPLLLLAHLDVVEAKREDWSVDPFTLLEKDGYFYGRGTGDDKAQAAIWVANLIRYKQEGLRPARDLIVALTADEEGGGPYNGVDWLLKNRRELIDAEYCLNEGGWGEIARRQAAR